LFIREATSRRKAFAVAASRCPTRKAGTNFVSASIAHHGYAVTSHSSQGQTADRVLINVDTELGAKDLLNNRMAYVAVSRGAYDVQLFTDSREKLGSALGHDVLHQSVHKPDRKPPQSEIAETPNRKRARAWTLD
jgi:hypothetical protein